MNSVIVLPGSAFLEPLPARVRPGDAGPVPHARPQYVYGDSTPFQAGVDFIATLRALVACGVSLMKAQHAIDCARSRVAEAEEHLVALDADLGAMASAVEAALVAGGPRQVHVRDVAHRVATMTRAAVLSEVRRAQASLDASVVRADRTILEARKSAALSVGELLARHELPGTTTGFRIFAADGCYGAEVIAGLSCGLRATFDAALPEGHAWRALRRVRHVREGVMVTLPHELGWFRKRVEPVTLRLDGLTILGASLEGAHGALLLGKNERSGIAHAFDVDLSSAQPRVKWRNADDTVVIDLGVEDAACITKLLRAVEQATRELVPARRTLTDATLDAVPLGQCDPGEVCARLVRLVAADALEIARRAGAPGELVLRRNVDSGHRDEVFVTTAELLEQVETLPPSLRRVFAP
ncbi:MAG TPA: hypothetical protein VHS09_05910, partial [Polyangiaceae bacterium]|nr:hypothetical protein [Polyangiaceae bacterium]